MRDGGVGRVRYIQSMISPTQRAALQLRSLVKRSGELELSLATVETPTPDTHEVVVRIEATPINPSDIGLLFAAADPSAAKVSGAKDRPVLTAPIADAAMKSLAGRVDASLPVGNEGAGRVVEAGASDAAQALLGKLVALSGGAMYSQYRCVPIEQCLVLPDDAKAADGAAAFVNPLTALGMVETMRREGHTALVHTAATSNVGQMLQRICLGDEIPLVNIVRKADQVAQLREMGAQYVCDASAPTFLADLTEALLQTGATLAFDATGGGKLAGQILGCMEAAQSSKATSYSRYGSTTHKQVYIYGGLQSGPTELNRNFGMAWGVGGWLVSPFLQKLGAAATETLKRRVVAELKTTFASHYAQEISLAEVLSPAAIAVYAQRTTGGKFLINPNKTAV
jgi:NADPH2:quinone reductase